MPSDKNIAVYTAIFGDYDTLKEPKYPIALLNEADFFCFTDNKNIRSSFYQVIYVTPKFEQRVLNARFFKTMSHKLFPHYEYTIWHDGAFQIITSTMSELIKKYMIDNHYIASFNHPERDDLYDEAIECIKRRKERPIALLWQVFKCYWAGMPTSFGLIESSVLIRRGDKCVDLVRLNEIWWKEIRENTSRDQISFSYVWWKNKAKVNFIAGHNKRNSFFLRSPHQPNREQQSVFWRIVTNRYFSPIIAIRKLAVTVILFLKQKRRTTTDL